MGGRIRGVDIRLLYWLSFREEFLDPTGLKFDRFHVKLNASFTSSLKLKLKHILPETETETFLPEFPTGSGTFELACTVLKTCCKNQLIPEPIKTFPTSL